MKAAEPTAKKDPAATDTDELGDAVEEWERLNDPAMCPVSGQAACVHPQRADVLREFMRAQGWGPDMLAPITPTLSVEALAGEMLIAAKAELETANAGMLSAEREAHAAFMGD